MTRLKDRDAPSQMLSLLRGERLIGEAEERKEKVEVLITCASSFALLIDWTFRQGKCLVLPVSRLFYSANYI